jgi:cell division protein ZapA (FtsZ GTPase activity inhibitor)
LSTRRAVVEGAVSPTAEAEELERDQVGATKAVRRTGSADPPSLRELPGELLQTTPSAASRKSSVAVQIANREYRIRSDADPKWLQQVAGQVDRAMTLIRERTETVDTLEIAVLTALNLAREIVLLREQLAALGEQGPGAGDGSSPIVDSKRLRELIELAESALDSPDRGA